MCVNRSKINDEINDDYDDDEVVVNLVVANSYDVLVHFVNLTMDKSADLKDLDLTCASRGVWLVKVPKYISECWKKAGPGEEVGKVVISKQKGTSEVKFSVNDRLAAAAMLADEPTTIPTDHIFTMTGIANQTMSVLSTESLPGSSSNQHSTISEYQVAVEGKVIQRAECRPIENAGYMALKRSRLEAGNRPRNEVVQLSKPVNIKPKSIHESELEYNQRKKEEGKKTRLEKEQVQELLFAAFEKHQYYNVKDLVRITNQPITFLKEVLKEICKYNMKAPHKNMWELKEEYRHYKQSVTDSSN